MNVILNTDEANAVLALVTSTVLDNVELSEETRERIRRWRTDRAPGAPDLDGFALGLNEAIGNYIDDRTRRMVRLRGKVKVREA